MISSIISEPIVYLPLEIFHQVRILNKKEKLVEKLGVHLENKEQIAPLAARIISKLILLGKKGITFEELVCDLGASKSTISSHLTNLQASQRITYFTKPGDRKKYFILSPDAMIKSMTEMLKTWELESVLHREVMAYKEEVNRSIPEDSDEKFELDFHKDYISFLEQASASIKKLREKLSEKE